MGIVNMVHLLKDKKSLFFIYLVISFTYCLVGFIFFNYPFSSCGYWYLFKKKKRQDFGFVGGIPHFLALL